jgi:hypothetical protein
MRRVVIMAALAAAALGPGPALAGGASPEPEGGVTRGRLLRVIDDPSTGARWLLYEDTQHPGGPARLVEIALKEVKTGWSSSLSKKSDERPLFRIHAGDRLTVEEHTPVADSRLAAVALGQAGKGEELEVRLEIGGRVVKAVAEGPGRARLAEGSGGRP